MDQIPRANLTGSDIVTFIDVVTTNLETLAPLLDDLNALRGADFDTGSNASRTVQAVSRMLRSADIDREHAGSVLAACTLYARTGAVGHVGLLIANTIAALAQAVTGSLVRPIDLRKFLSALPDVMERGFSHPDPEIMVMVRAAQMVADKTSDPIDAVHVMIGEASMEAQGALIEETSGWVNPGAGVLTVLFAALHSLYENDDHPLTVVSDMMRDLATTASRKPLTANEPEAGAEFSVDFHVDCAIEDFDQFVGWLTERDSRYSVSGAVDVLGMGSWRFHIDTSSPTSVLPSRGWVRHIVAKDARYGELIGHDELALQQEASGVLYLSRPTWQRPDTVRVIALLRNSYFLDEVAATGAHVVFNPDTHDAVTVAELMRSAPAGVSLILPADLKAQEVAERALRLASDTDDVTVVCDREPFSDVAVSVCAVECAPIFMPSVGARTATVTAEVLTSHVKRAKGRVAIVHDADLENMYSQLIQLIGYGLQRVLVLATDDTAQALSDIVARALVERNQGTAHVEVISADANEVVLVNA
ncbi:MAG: hypothetical protein Q4P71_05290 [Actinomycetaceae bacterium]|nr:hypothetical protein [Actinomycetaceae bacterium]